MVEREEGKPDKIPKPDDLEENMWLIMKQPRGMNYKNGL